MNKEDQIALFHYMLEHLRKFRKEMIAAHMAISTLPDVLSKEIRDRIEECKKEKSIESLLDKEFHDFDKTLEIIDESHRDQELLKLLKQYKPSGKPN